MSKVMRVVGYVWTAPVTLLALMYVLAFSALGWYKFVSVFGDALVWTVQQEKLPALLTGWWRRWGGHCFGNVVVLRVGADSDRGKIILRHEQEHVRQFMILGIFWPLLYALNYLTIKLGCPSSHPYYDNSLEIDARRAAGQIIDVIGTVRRIQAANRAKDK